MNQCFLIGRLVADPDLQRTRCGLARVVTRIAVERPDRKKGGTENSADLIRLILWRHVAEYAARYLTEGHLVAVEGWFEFRSWTDQGGGKRETAQVVVSQIHPLEWRAPRAETVPIESVPAESAPAESPPATPELASALTDPFEDEALGLSSPMRNPPVARRSADTFAGFHGLTQDDEDSVRDA